MAVTKRDIKARRARYDWTEDVERTSQKGLREDLPASHRFPKVPPEGPLVPKATDAKATR